MISTLLIASCPSLKKVKIVAYDDYGLWLHHFAKTLNVFLKNYKKTGNYHQKEGCGHNRKTLHLKILSGHKFSLTSFILIKKFLSAIWDGGGNTVIQNEMLIQRKNVNNLEEYRFYKR